MVRYLGVIVPQEHEKSHTPVGRQSDKLWEVMYNETSQIRE